MYFSTSSRRRRDGTSGPREPSRMRWPAPWSPPAASSTSGSGPPAGPEFNTLLLSMQFQ